MSPVETALVAVALGCDAFAVGLAVGTRYGRARQVFRLSFHFGLFQFMMPLLGWWAGRCLRESASRWGPWIAAVLLVFIAVRMVIESSGEASPEDDTIDPTRGFRLIVLSVATSLDALGVGVGFGLLGERLLWAAVWIGLTAGVMTWSAMRLGHRLSQRFGRRMGIAGGIVLLLIAVKLVAF